MDTMQHGVNTKTKRYLRSKKIRNNPVL